MSDNIEKHYEYPDRTESITLSLIQATERYHGYWQISEDKVIHLMKKKMRQNCSNGKLLDAGCGQGRLLQTFSPFFDQIDAVEPDIQRYEICKQNVHSWCLDDKVNLYHCDILKINKKEYYDFILCSHVLQHIPEQEVEALLNAFSNLLKKDGMLFITTTHSINSQVRYCESYLDSIKNRVERTINQKEFNQFVNLDGILPIKFFTYDSIVELLKKYNLKIIEYKVYHGSKGVKWMDKVFGADWLINLNHLFMKKNGRDLFVCAIPRKAPRCKSITFK